MEQKLYNALKELLKEYDQHIPEDCTCEKALLAAQNARSLLNEIRDRLKYLRGEIEGERISYGEIVELQSLAQYINPSDTLLLEWAGIPEHDEEESENE